METEAATAGMADMDIDEKKFDAAAAAGATASASVPDPAPGGAAGGEGPAEKAGAVAAAGTEEEGGGGAETISGKDDEGAAGGADDAGGAAASSPDGHGAGGMDPAAAPAEEDADDKDGRDGPAAAEAQADAPATDFDTDEEEDLVDADADDDLDDDGTKKIDLTADPTQCIVQAMEQKELGNAFFKSGDLQSAVRSYRKGTTLLKPLNENNTGDDQVKSLLVTLQTNLSTVCYRQTKYKMSRDVASKALTVDPTSVKALYRRAASHRKLGDADAARSDLREALRHDPTNREVRRELASIKKEVEAARLKEKERLQRAFSKKAGSSFLYDDKEEEERRKEEERKAKKEAEAEALRKRKVEFEEDCVQRMAAGEPALLYEDWDKERKKKEEEEDKARKKAKKEEEERRREERRAAREAERAAREAAKGAGGDEAESDDDDDELTEKELATMRGYKKTKDGRTTSYFTREIKEEEKALLESSQVGPKKIDVVTTSPSSSAIPAPAPAGASSPTPTPAAAATTPAASASAWNQAGTWEEKDTTDWCTSCLKRHLKSATAELLPDSDSAPGYDEARYAARVTGVKDLTGDASVVLTRGRKRYVFDYHLSVQFDVTATVAAPEGDDDGADGGAADVADVTDDGDEGDGGTTTAAGPKVVATGTLKLPDINSTVTVDELEIEPTSGWKKKPRGEHAHGVVECREALMVVIRDKVRSFVEEFNAQY